MERRARRVPPQVRRAHWAQGAARDGRLALQAAGQHAAAKAEPAER